jgi:hypothetical protein
VTPFISARGGRDDSSATTASALHTVDGNSMQSKYLAVSTLSSLMLASAAWATIPPPPNAIYRGGFDIFPLGNVPAGPTVVPSTADHCPNGVDGWRRFLTIRSGQMEVVSSPVAEGDRALKAQVQYGDVYPGMSESRTLMDPCTPQSVFYAGDPDKWYRWQVQLPADYRSDFPKWDQLGSSDATTTARKAGAYNVEWHNAGSSGSAPMYMKTKNGSFTLCNNPDPFTACSEVGREWFILPLQRGIWIDWLVDYHPSAGSDGFMDIWADTGGGLQLLQANTAQVAGCTHTYCGPTAYGDPAFFDNPNDKFHYWEVGLYRDLHVGDPAQRYTSGALVYPDSPTPTTVYFDGWAIGNTRASVYNAPLGGAPPAGCSQTNPAVATLSDTFGGTSIDTTKWAPPTQTQGTVTESGGFLHEAPTANAAAAGLLLQSNGTYDLRSSMAWVRAAQVVANGTVDTNFTLLADGQNHVSWIFSGTTLKARKVVGNVNTYLASLTYDPAVHAFWRIRETAGSVYWETSADGSSWTIQANDLTSRLGFVCGVKPTFYTETWAAMASPGEARFANFNVAPSGGLPLVSSLSDSFAGTAIDLTKWAPPTQTQGTVTESGGFLHEAPTANAAGASLLLQSSGTYSLNGSAAYVKASQVLGSGNQDMNFTMLQDANHLVSWLYSNGTLKARFANNAAPVVLGTPLTYNPAVHVWWRVREAGGTVFWDTSPDGLTWTNQATAATPTWLATGIKPVFFVESFGVAAPGEARFASFNVGP